MCTYNLCVYVVFKQGMLDFDNLCSREVPSVAAMVYPFSGNHKQKFYWGHKEIMIPGKIASMTRLSPSSRNCSYELGGQSSWE